MREGGVDSWHGRDGSKDRVLSESLGVFQGARGHGVSAMSR